MIVTIQFRLQGVNKRTKRKPAVEYRSKYRLIYCAEYKRSKEGINILIRYRKNSKWRGTFILVLLRHNPPTIERFVKRIGVDLLVTKYSIIVQLKIRLKRRRIRDPVVNKRQCKCYHIRIRSADLEGQGSNQQHR